MSRTRFQRSLSLALAVFFTLVILAGIDELSQVDEPTAQWAQNTSARA